jgi:hypothetical protein
MRRAERSCWYFFLIVRDGLRCAYCGALLKVPGDRTKRQGCRSPNLEHFDPDGPDSADNLFLACSNCNASKGHHVLPLVSRPEPRFWVGSEPMIRSGVSAWRYRSFGGGTEHELCGVTFSRRGFIAPSFTRFSE